MMKRLLRRLGFYLIAAWVSLSLNFVLPRLMPGDPASALMARFRGQVSPDALDALRAAFGTNDESLLSQYVSYLGHLFSGEFGLSVTHFPAPVTEVIATGLSWTVYLAGSAVVVSFVLGSTLGALAAWYRGGLLDRIAPPVLVFLSAFPYFWLAMLALLIFGFQLQWFPLSHAYDSSLDPSLSLEFLGSVLSHSFLPGAVIVLATLGGWMLNMRNTMVGVLAEDYVVLAQAKGLPARRVMFTYAARNALLPNVTGFGMALGFVLSGSLLTEIVFSYPGLGYLMIEAVHNQDYPLLQGLFLCITSAVLVANWLVDIAVVLLDPRARS
jgi:peptide/nickel transport system permease protein